MANYKKRFIRLFFGLFLIGLSTFFNGVSGMGYTPWGVLNDGISKTTGITYGQANIIIGIAVLLVDILSGEVFGLGTILNIVCIGVFVDIMNWLNNAVRFLPVLDNVYYNLALCVLAAALNIVGIYFYISIKMGCGPRDCLSIVITKKTPMSLGTSRLLLDLGALVVGYMLKGTVGIGTLIITLTKGPGLQLACKIGDLDVRAYSNESVTETIKKLVSMAKESK